MKNIKDIRFAFNKSLVIMPGYIVVGIGFGVMMADAGYTWIWSLAMCIFVFGGSLQYAAVGLLSGGASIVTTAMITLMLHTRQFVYSLSMLDRYKPMGKIKPYLIYYLSDETYSIVSTDEIIPKSINRKIFYSFMTFFNQLWWIIGCLTGTILGPVIPFDTTGIDFAMTALFVVIFIEQWICQKEHRPALIGLGITFISLKIFGAENFLPPALLMIIVILLFLKKKIENKEIADIGKGGDGDD